MSSSDLERLRSSLSKLSPSDIKPENLKTFREFFGRSTPEDCLQLLPDSYKEALVTFDSRGISVQRLVQSFAEAKDVSSEIYSNLWHNRFDTEHKSRVQRLRDSRQKIGKTTIEDQCAARLCLMFAVHELQYYSSMASKNDLELQAYRRRSTASLDKFSAAHNIERDSLLKDNKKSRNLFYLFFKAGPGYVMKMRLSAVSASDFGGMNKKDLDTVLESSEKFPEFHKQAIESNSTSARDIVEGLLAYGWTENEIISGATPFLKRLREFLGPKLEIKAAQDVGKISEGQSGTNDWHSDRDRTTEYNRRRKRHRLNEESAESSVDDDNNTKCQISYILDNGR